MKNDELKLLVEKAYNKKSINFAYSDKRKKWKYLASKILSDERLFYKTNFENKIVLNIGCAPHPIDEIYFAHFTKFWIALDLNFNVLNAAQQIVNDELSQKIIYKLTFCKANAGILPFKNNSFDVVTAFSSLEHIPDENIRNTAFKEISRVTKKGGYVVVTVPNKWNLAYVLWSKNEQKNKKAEFGYETYFSPIELKKILIKNGFKPIEFASNFIISPFIWMKKLDFLDFIKYFGYRMGYCAIKIK